MPDAATCGGWVSRRTVLAGGGLLTLASSVTLVQIPFPDMAEALTSGRIAAGWFDEPFLSKAQTIIGAQTLFDTSQGSTANFPISGYMSTRAWATRYPNTARAFVRVITRGQTLADTSRAARQRSTCPS